MNFYNDKNDEIKIIIDAGHGGDDPGAISGNLKEKDYTIKISKYIKKRLEQLGLKPFMTREEDIYLPKEDRINKILNYTKGDPALLISNHINAGGQGGQSVINE